MIVLYPTVELREGGGPLTDRLSSLSAKEALAIAVKFHGYAAKGYE